VNSNPPNETTTNPNPHPFARSGILSGALGMKSGCRFISATDGRHGWADEFIRDGYALVTFDDGAHEEIKWTLMSPENKDA